MRVTGAAAGSGWERGGGGGHVTCSPFSSSSTLLGPGRLIKAVGTRLGPGACGQRAAGFYNSSNLKERGGEGVGRFRHSSPGRSLTRLLPEIVDILEKYAGVLQQRFLNEVIVDILEK